MSVFGSSLSFRKDKDGNLHIAGGVYEVDMAIERDRDYR
jgi:hypothetical protein